MIRRTGRGSTPKELTLVFADRHVVDAGVPLSHQAMLAEQPVLVTVSPIPCAFAVAPFVSEAHSDAIVGKGPKLLDESILGFLLPFAGQEFDDRRSALDELAPISPLAVDRIGRGHSRRIAGVPGVFRLTNFLDRGLLRERRHRWPIFGQVIHERCSSRTAPAVCARSAWFSASRAAMRLSNGDTAVSISAAVKRGVICWRQFQSRFRGAAETPALASLCSREEQDASRDRARRQGRAL